MYQTIAPTSCATRPLNIHLTLFGRLIPFDNQPITLLPKLVSFLRTKLPAALRRTA